MDHFENKEQDYTKWDESIWLSVEKAISQFQHKVTESMLKIGQLGKTKIEDFKVEPLLDDDVVLGQDFYIELIRPVCATKGYLPKQIPTEADLQEGHSDDSDLEEPQMNQRPSMASTAVPEKREKPKQTEKRGAKKGSKNNQKSNDSQIKMKIIKENFLKELDLVLNSHSSERMQFQFGLKQKKLQLRLITFFYIAYYIRKNKQKQKIDESQVFQLINIMQKIVRIFDGFKGKSFFSSGSADKKKKKQVEDELTEVSPTEILDMRMCIKGLKDFYKYTNKKIIINYPKLVYYTNYDKFFPTLDIKPYVSQIEFIQAVKKAFNIEKGTITNPTLILYRTMIGSGKTSASLSLSNLINQTKLMDQKNGNYQILYSCLIGSVRVQVGRYAYNKEQKFALAAMEKSIKDQNYYYPRIINSYSCKNDKVVDLIISDLDCSYAMFDRHHYNEIEEDIMKHQRKERKARVNLGRLEKQNIVMFIDEPTAFCKDINSPPTVKIFNILANYPPKVIILASATMPPKQQLKNTIKLIETRNPGLQVFQIDSKEFQIGCQYCSFKGEIIFPHTNVKNKEELKKIIELVDKNPFLLRLYTGPSLYFLLKKCQKANIDHLPKIQQLPQIKQQYISKCTMRILNTLLKYDDNKIREVCELSVDQANINYKMIEKEEDSDDDIFGGGDDDEEDKKEKEGIKEEGGEKEDYVNFKKMLRQDAHKFLGGCLIATSNPLEFAHTHFERWLRVGKKEQIKPVRRLLEKYQKQVQALQKEIKLLEDDDRRDDTVTKQITKLQTEKQPKMDFPDHKRINTMDHYNRYCKEKQPVHISMLIKPMTIETVAAQLIEQVDDFVLKLLFCGVALYMEKGLSPKYLDKVQELASLNYLAYIITDQSLCYGTNFPISNVILCDDLATKLNMNEMFQLIGRAGRVGQSWTARAFLQANGLQKLSEYIHSEDQKMSQQAEIFETIAQNCLDNPQLSLRTPKSEIKYVNIWRPDERIEIIIKKKKQQDYHIFRKVCLVPFLNSDKRILCRKMPYKVLNSYQLPKSDLLYSDLPTTPNSKGQPVLDVQLYYKNQQQFIRRTLDNAYKRILNTVLEGKLINGEQVNQFKPKVYEDFFCMRTNTFAILVRCGDQVEIGDFGFQKLKKNDIEQLDQILMDKIKKYVDTCKQIARRVLQSPSQILQTDIRELKKTHQDLLTRTKTPFYRQIYQTNLPPITQLYSNLTSSIQDKNSLETSNQSIIALLVAQYGDIDQIDDRWFHIDGCIRGIWSNVIGEIEKNE